MKARRRYRLVIVVATIVLGAGGAAMYQFGRSMWHPFYRKIMGARTIEQVVQELEATAGARIRKRLAAADVAYPPSQLTLIVLKEEKRLEVWAAVENNWRFIHSYDVLAASGTTGPKLREGDRQVPEGFYRLTSLNPNSAYHLSLKLDYPNEFDRLHAQTDGRSNLGGDIFIHGKAVSIGCLAIGDSAIEDLFVLASATGLDGINVILAPNDLRRSPPNTPENAWTEWLSPLYEALAQSLSSFPR